MNTYWSIEQLLSEELLISTEFSNNSKYLGFLLYDSLEVEKKKKKKNKNKNKKKKNKNKKQIMKKTMIRMKKKDQIQSGVVEVTLPFQYLPNTLNNFQNSSPILVRFDTNENSDLKLHYYYLGSYLSDLINNTPLSKQLSQLFVRRFSNLVSLSQREIKLIYNRHKHRVLCLFPEIKRV
ncbi:hypothetical protein M0812_27872 [Anaeramoeba flamelloides]|uniref:Uncharacterized protein n=1 Tax=Anaeramoeba flamelloides TaxID=1746091 RepID=A0AAV7YC21_9EUKA|nr:hypothetical protein M0812_27872 [Anaeramoeba flamelloides]